MCVAALAVGCGGPPRSSARHREVDPQVLRDVIEATFKVPGDGVRRSMRIYEFSAQAGRARCGVAMGSLDATNNREDQLHFPDLDLIRARGFSEPDRDRRDERLNEKVDPHCDSAPPMPSFEKWFVLDQPWIDVVNGVMADSLPRFAGSMTACLVRRTGLKFETADPTTFLKSVNIAQSAGATGADLKRYAAAYADCAEGFYGEVRRKLLQKRPAYVERNRELIEKFAEEIVEAGYAP